MSGESTPGVTARPITIAVDAMGGDHAPAAIVEGAVAAAIAQHRADWGIAIAPVANLYGLGFLPIAPEHYDFLVVEARRQRPAVRAFIEVLQDEAVRDRIRALGMEPAAQESI